MDGQGLLTLIKISFFYRYFSFNIDFFSQTKNSIRWTMQFEFEVVIWKIDYKEEFDAQYWVLNVLGDFLGHGWCLRVNYYIIMMQLQCWSYYSSL